MMTAFPRCPECNGQRVPMNYVGDVVGAVCYCGFARRAEPSTSFEDVYRTQTAEITRLRAEVESWQESAIACQRSSAEFAAEADRLRAEVEALKAENARLHTANERMRAALERFRCRDWTPDWVRDIANRALEGGE